MKYANGDERDNIWKYNECIDTNGKEETKNMPVATNFFNGSNPTKSFDQFRDMLRCNELM